MLTGAPLFASAVAIGVAIAAPVGPMALLCIERTLLKGSRAGLATGLGVALADGFWAVLIGFSASSLAAFLLDHSNLLRLVGGLLIAALGVLTVLRARRTDEPLGGGAKASRSGALLSAFALTATNPATILAFIGIFASLGLDNGIISRGDTVLAIAGIFLGSLLWWIGLTLAVTAIRHQLSWRAIVWINRLSGLALIAFGLGAAASGLD